MNWNKVASRISELIRMNRYFTPDEQALYDKAQAQDVVRNTAYDSYNAIKEAHPDDLVLFQIGDFFELYGEDAKQASDLLNMNLTSRSIPGAGRVEMCGVPSHNLEMYVEKLRDKYDVTIAEAPDLEVNATFTRCALSTMKQKPPSTYRKRSLALTVQTCSMILPPM